MRRVPGLDSLRHLLVPCGEALHAAWLRSLAPSAHGSTARSAQHAPLLPCLNNSTPVSVRRYRFKSSALLSLAVTLLRLVASSGEEGARQLAALPHAWKLLCSYIMVR